MEPLTYVFMVLFNASLLIGAVRVTVKELRSTIIEKSTLLNRSRIHKFPPIVSKDHLKCVLEYTSSAPFFQIIEGSPDFIAGFAFEQEKEHQLRSSGEKGKKNLTALPSYYGVHFPDVQMGVFFKKRIKFQICSALSIGVILQRGQLRIFQLYWRNRGTAAFGFAGGKEDENGKEKYEAKWKAF